jgi:hypothetical protein
MGWQDPPEGPSEGAAGLPRGLDGPPSSRYSLRPLSLRGGLDRRLAGPIPGL